jgi:hypothetical protein
MSSPNWLRARHEDSEHRKMPESRRGRSVGPFQLTDNAIHIAAVAASAQDAAAL